MSERLPRGVGSSSARWLFSRHFLDSRLPGWPDFAGLESAPLHAELVDLWRAERDGLAGANEAQTEERLIRPILRALGHELAVQVEIPGAGRTLDYVLLPASTSGRTYNPLERGVALAEAKRFELPLDRRAPDGDPVAQVRSYLALSRLPFGILTNGRVWRLYWRDAPLVERPCHEIDLGALLEDGGVADLAYFTLFFAASAFAIGHDGRSFLERALDDSALHAVEITDALERAVFAAVPPIAEGLLGDDERTREALDAAFAHALVVLYRTLFCLYAEARGLLPVAHSDYRRYSIAEHRLEVARLLDEGRHLSTRSGRLYDTLQALFTLIDEGEPGLGVTAFDGGLFDPEEHPWLRGRAVPEALIAPALDGIYRVEGELVDYRDLSVRALGTVYERLLAWELVEDAEGRLVLVESPRRHETGSYFTPEPVVDAIVERTLDPLTTRLSERIAREGLRGEAALEALLGIRVLDPAMGSAHFLVAAAAFLAQAIATDPSYDGEASEDELRRLVAERCLYGVDLNPLAVELSRLSLWLVTARAGESLTFLGNLRVGDSLVGADVHTLLDRETGLIEAHLAAAAAELLRQTAELQRRVTHTRDDARAKRRLARELDGIRLPLAVFAHRSIERFHPPEGRERLHWPLVFPEVFLDERGEPRPDGGFDAVVGNPPYIRVQELGRDVADYCRRRFDTARGSFDAYVVFLERGLELLAPHGRLGFIVPNKLFKLDYGEPLRDLLSAGELVDEVLDFGASPVFAEATNYTCILVLDRAGVSELAYRRLRGTRAEVLEALAALSAVPPQRFPTRALGGSPWVLVPPEEAAVIDAASAGSERLDAVVQQIFQGLITSDDAVYVLEDRGVRAGRRVVYSRASGRELELEPDLLHPLARGGDVERYAFSALGSLLLFPYRRDGGVMRLLRPEELDALPLTRAYLAEHEARLRGRESGRMDRDGWWAFGRSQSLGHHDLPKLGVAATVRRLEVAADLDGSVYFHNVRVNGILGRSSGPDLAFLTAILNTRLLDWIFRRGAADHANDYFAANKQFIAGLPVRLPAGSQADELGALGRTLHGLAAALAAERGDFLRWLGATVGVPVATLARRRDLARADERDARAVIDALARLRPRPPLDPREREPRELIEREHRESAERAAALRADLRRAESRADAFVYELYELPAAMRAQVDAEYEERRPR